MHWGEIFTAQLEITSNYVIIYLYNWFGKEWFSLWSSIGLKVARNIKEWRIVEVMIQVGIVNCRNRTVPNIIVLMLGTPCIQ